MIDIRIEDARTFVRRCSIIYDIAIVDLFHGDNTPDYALKRIALYDLAWDMGVSMKWLQNFAWFYDDNLDVIEMGCKLKLNMVNSTLYNQKASK